MIRLVFYVEGKTEQAYVSRVLTPHLAPLGVVVEGAILVSTGRKRGIVFRGGGRRYAPAREELMRILAGRKGRDVRFTTMFDLYALPTDFPGAKESEKLRHVPRERVEAIERAFAADVGDDRLIPHIQLHEFETILLAAPSAFACYYEKCDREIKELQEIVETFGGPEDVNDGPQTAPSKRITAIFPDYADSKPNAPAVVSERIPLADVRACCPHFDTWLTTLERLGTP